MCYGAAETILSLTVSQRSVTTILPLHHLFGHSMVLLELHILRLCNCLHINRLNRHQSVPSNGPQHQNLQYGIPHIGPQSPQRKSSLG